MGDQEFLVRRHDECRRIPAIPRGVGMLQRDYLVDHLLADTAGLPVIASVHMQAAHGPARRDAKDISEYYEKGLLAHGIWREHS
jgi:hypothetical protein